MEDFKIGDIIEGEVFKISNFGAFVKFGKRTGLIHISQISDDYVKDINEHLKVGEKVKAKIVNLEQNGKIDLSLKKSGLKVIPDSNKFKEFKFLEFEQKLKSFLKKSQEKQIDLKKNIEAKQFKKRK